MRPRGPLWRVGEGWDTHALVEGRKLILGGVEIAHTHGLAGHSDADALCHAITDALFGAAALFALFGAGTLVAALVLALATAIDGWLAALVVAVVLLGGAGIMALSGKRQIAAATPPAPEQAVENVQADIEEVKRSVRA